MIINSHVHLRDERYQALLDAFHCMERDDTAGMAKAIAYWRVVEAYLNRVENNKKLPVRDPRSLTRYVDRHSERTIKYETLMPLAHGWIGRISKFPKTGVLFSDSNLTDAFVDNALPVAWDFQHDAVIIYGFHPMIAQVLRRKNQIKFLFVVDNSFDMGALQCPEEALFTLDAFMQTPPRHIVGNAQITASIHIGDSLQPQDIQRVEDLMNQQQLNTNAEQYFTQSEAQNFVDNIGQKIIRVLSRKNIDYFKDKNVIFASAGPSLATQLDDIAAYQGDFVICCIARSAQALHAHGIVPDIIFTADIQDLNIAFFEGLTVDNTILLAAIGTPNQIIALPFKGIFFIGTSKMLVQELNAFCPDGILAGQGGSVSVIGLSVLMSFAPQSIVISGQDLVYDGVARHSTMAKLAVEFDAAAAGDETRFTLPAQDGTLRHTSSDLKLFHSQIEIAVAQAGQAPHFATTLINASLGGALIEGFAHMGLADYAMGCPRGGAKKINDLLESLQEVVIDAKAFARYKKLRLRQIQKTMVSLKPVLAGLDDCDLVRRRTKSFLNMEQKLLKAIEAIPLLTIYAQAASLMLRSNTYESAVIIEGLKTDFHRTMLTFILRWNSALKKS